MDRLARSLSDLYAIVDNLTARGISVKFLKEGQTYSKDSTPVAKLMLGLLGSVAEFERSIIRERQAEGIARAKERGVYKAVRVCSPMSKWLRHTSGWTLGCRKQKSYVVLRWEERRCTATFSRIE